MAEAPASSSFFAVSRCFDSGEAEGTTVSSYLIEVTFQSIKDAEERAFFEAVPTALQLDDESIDRLIAVGRRLLRDSPEFQALLADFATEASAAPAPPPAE